MFQTYEEAQKLPEAWCHLTRSNPWLEPLKLSLLEEHQPCRQKYHLDPEEGIAFVSYALKVNALALWGKPMLKVPVRIVGLPFSLAECGYHAVTRKARQRMVRYICSQGGLWIILNAREDFPLPKGTTLPSCSLPVTWQSFDGYLASLRSPYRRWIRQSMNKGHGLTVRSLAPEDFSELHYRYYEEVYHRSAYPLEKLSFSYFQKFPASLYGFYLNQRPVGFVQLSMTSSVLTFMFCGFDRSLLHSHALYQNMLLWMLQLAIQEKCVRIDFGQTTEVTKTKLGAAIHQRHFYLSHKNPVIMSMMKPLSRWLSYPGYSVDHHVFKESSP